MDTVLIFILVILVGAVLYSMINRTLNKNEVDGEQLHGYPVYQEDGKWYFWDEAGYTSYGPYDSEEVAKLELTKYAATL